MCGNEKVSPPDQRATKRKRSDNRYRSAYLNVVGRNRLGDIVMERIGLPRVIKHLEKLSTIRLVERNTVEAFKESVTVGDPNGGIIRVRWKSTWIK